MPFAQMTDLIIESRFWIAATTFLGATLIAELALQRNFLPRLAAAMPQLNYAAFYTNNGFRTRPRFLLK